MPPQQSNGSIRNQDRMRPPSDNYPHDLDSVVIPNDVTPTEYYCLIMCHGISVNNELQFTKALQKLGAQSQNDLSDYKASMVFELMYGKSFEQIQHFYSIQFRNLMSESLQLAIRRQREVIAHDLLLFAHTRLYSLSISDKEIEFLVLNEMYHLVQEMI
jgi:hypothetical protein